MDPSRDRLIAFVDDDNPRIRAAIEKLSATLRSYPMGERHHAVVRLIPVDLWNPEDIEKKIIEVVRLRPAVIVAANSQNAAIAKRIVTDTPIVFGSHQDPIRTGLVASLAHPGGNLTGFTYFVPIDLKRLELLRQVIPRATRVGIVIDRWWMQESGGAEVVRAARGLGLEPHIFLVESASDLQRELATPRARSMDAWFVPSTALPFEESAALLRGLDALRKPVIFPATSFVERGGLMSYQQVLTLDDTVSLLATMIGLILDGVAPGEIPIERPKSFELAVNVDAARALGIVVPESLLKRANRVLYRQGPP